MTIYLKHFALILGSISILSFSNKFGKKNDFTIEIEGTEIIVSTKKLHGNKLFYEWTIIETDLDGKSITYQDVEDGANSFRWLPSIGNNDIILEIYNSKRNETIKIKKSIVIPESLNTDPTMIVLN